VRERRFTNPKKTSFGRIGHPAPLDRKLVRCIGVTFGDVKLDRKWTFRRYEAYRDEWPEVDVWTVQVLIYPTRRGQIVPQHGPQTAIDESEVPIEVREFAWAELVRLRLRGRVFA
jgi:hypothetical protein